jgi:hypothetical protein
MLLENNQERIDFYVGIEVIVAVVMKVTTFLDISPFSPLKTNRRF